MVMYVDVSFDVSLPESTFLADLKILATVCNVKEQDEPEDKKLIEQDEKESPKKPPLSDVAYGINLIQKWSLFDADRERI